MADRRLFPIQCATAEDVQQSYEEDEHEYGHLDQAEQAELLVLYRPWIEKDNFNVEENEEDSNEVELDRDAFHVIALAVHPTFERFVF